MKNKVRQTNLSLIELISAQCNQNNLLCVCPAPVVTAITVVLFCSVLTHSPPEEEDEEKG